MGRCWACDGELDPDWKFCVHCGIPIEHDETPTVALSTVTRTPASSTLAIFGWIMVGIGVLLISGGVFALLHFA